MKFQQFIVTRRFDHTFCGPLSGDHALV